MCSRRQLRRREAGWRAAGGERAARRMTNPIRRRVAASLLIDGEACGSDGKGQCPDRKDPIGRAGVTRKRDVRAHNVVGSGMLGRQSGISGETCRTCEGSTGVRARIVLHAAVRRGNARTAKPRRGKAGQEGGCVRYATKQTQHCECSQELSKMQNPRNCHGAKLQADPNAWSRRWQRRPRAPGTGQHGPRPLCTNRAARFTRLDSQQDTPSRATPPTGEPYAGKPPVRFGGRGG
jgi:hypothetical protein